MPTYATGDDDAESLTSVTRADWMIILALCDCNKCANKAWICLSELILGVRSLSRVSVLRSSGYIQHLF